MSSLRIDPKRPRSDLEALAAFGRTSGNGVDRPASSAADLQARAWLAERCRTAGSPGREDGIVDLFVRLGTGDDGRAPVEAGAHLCSTPDGGRFDDAAGVVGAVEVLRWLREERVPLVRQVEAAAWAEEGCYRELLDPTAAVDGLSADDLDRLVGRDGHTLRRAMRDAGRVPGVAVRVRQPAETGSADTAVTCGNARDTRRRRHGPVDCGLPVRPSPPGAGRRAGAGDRGRHRRGRVRRPVRRACRPASGRGHSRPQVKEEQKQCRSS